ncbi:Acetyltransferase (isoleucine patch superfamily) [Xaviernesmea oryzae]|uniref:Acetyltransferase (Isoleucine patch superfamily) n=1 Tax=Xaviernesmea oryzae TaxID=464029 RepID=A0A1X7GRN4_9HYPH|nr:acyltransferase [Xaviernesmea oryzae]SMF73715.1 Acetyltransferase (isoleucine patch superfamily) [Xaviernesmea oryzae]
MRLPSMITMWCRVKSLFVPGKVSIGARSEISLRSTIIFKKGEVRIGRKIKVHPGVIIDAQKGRILIGNNVSLNPYTMLYGAGNITIGDNVRIAAHTVIVSFDHNFNEIDRPITFQGITRKPIEIGDDVWIGAGAKILGGSQIAKGCVIGANAVVKGKTEPYGIYVGNPARLIKRRGEAAFPMREAGVEKSFR